MPERWYVQPEVPGSIPGPRTIFPLKLFKSASHGALRERLNLHNIYVTVYVNRKPQFKSHRVCVHSMWVSGISSAHASRVDMKEKVETVSGGVPG